MPILTDDEIRKKAIDLYMKDHPWAETTPTDEELKEANYWKKAKQLSNKAYHKKLIESWEDKMLADYESTLKKLTSNYVCAKETIDIDKIIRCPVLPERQLGDLEALSETIKKVGLLFPVILRISKEKEGFYELISGGRRVGAYKMAEKKNIDALVYSDLPDELVFPISGIENWHRKSLYACEWVAFFQAWSKATGIKQNKIAKMMGVTEQEISNIMRINQLPDEIKNLNAFKSMTLSMCLSLLKVEDSSIQLKMAKELNSYIKNNPNLPQHKISKQFYKILAQHVEAKPDLLNQILKMVNKDFKDPFDRKILADLFLDSLAKLDLYKEFYSTVWSYITQETDEEVSDVDFRIESEDDKVICRILGYTNKQGEYRKFEGAIRQIF